MKKRPVKKVIKTKITFNKEVAADHYMMEIKAPQLSRVSIPGQFVAIKVQEEATDPLLRIPLGVHAMRSKCIRLLYKVVGPGTELLSQKRKDQMLNVLGPLGNGFDLTPLLRKKYSRVIIASGGHGVAPLYALAEAVVKKRKKVHFFNGASTKRHIVCSKELKKLGVDLHVATEDGTQGYRGYVTGLLKRHLKKDLKNETENAIIFACGPRPMLADVAKIAKEFKIPAQVSLDAYMACGIGACMGCSVQTTSGYKLACKDGPVFDAREVKWGKVK